MAKIVEDPDYLPTPEEAEEILAIYSDFLNHALSLQEEFTG